MAGGAADPPRLSRRVARARADDGPHRHGAGAHLRRARGRRAGRRDPPRHRQAAGAGLRQRRDQLHPRRQPGRPHRAGPGAGARHRPGHLRLPRRPAGRARAPGAVAPRQPRARIAGRAEERRGLHPRRRGRAGRPAPPGAAGAAGRGPDPAFTPWHKRLGRVLYRGPPAPDRVAGAGAATRRRSSAPSAFGPEREGHRAAHQHAVADARLARSARPSGCAGG